MTNRKLSRPDVDWAEALGADYNFPVGSGTFATPLDLIELREVVAARIRSAGGRPTDKTWSIERQVPFRKEVWGALQEMSQQLREAGASASPAQLAALFIEQGVKSLGYPVATPARKTRKRASPPRAS